MSYTPACLTVDSKSKPRGPKPYVRPTMLALHLFAADGKRIIVAKALCSPSASVLLCFNMGLQKQNRLDSTKTDRSDFMPCQTRAKNISRMSQR